MLASGAYNVVYTKAYVFCVTFPRVSFALASPVSPFLLLVLPPPSCLPCSKLKRLAGLFVYTLGHVLHFYFVSIMGNFLGRGAAS